MSFFIEDSCFILTHLLYKAALILAVLRWFFSWAITIRNRTTSSSTSSAAMSAAAAATSQTIRESLVLTTFADVAERRVIDGCDTCAVCLSQLRERDEVRELRNCCHVFHRECIDRWVDHDHDDNHRSCPLCRAPLMRDSQELGWARNEPSWAVERLLYLFGDDLLI